MRTQLATIARASTFVDWQHRRAVVDDLQLQRRAIVDTVAPRDQFAGLDLMWRFLALAGSVFARCDDSSGTVIGVFDAAVSDLGQNPNSRCSNCSWSPVLGPRQKGIEALFETPSGERCGRHGAGGGHGAALSHPAAPPG